jgi:hypothetical protein
MVLVERQHLPLGIAIASASPAEVTLVAATLATRVTHPPAQSEAPPGRPLWNQL